MNFFALRRTSTAAMPVEYAALHRRMKPRRPSRSCSVKVPNPIRFSQYVSAKDRQVGIRATINSKNPNPMATNFADFLTITDEGSVSDGSVRGRRLSVLNAIERRGLETGRTFTD
jgi:hypothetical protein